MNSAKKIDAYVSDGKIIINTDNVNKGDYILLDNLSNFDEYINKKIETEHKQKIINSYKNSDEYKSFLNSKENEIKIKNDELNKIKELFSNEKNKLNETIHKLEIDKIKAVTEYKNSEEYNNLVNELTITKSTLASLHQSFNEKIKQEKTNIEKDFNHKIEKMNLETEKRISDSYYDHINKYKNTEEYLSLVKEINDLKRDFNSKNVKLIGEDLEHYCMNQWENVLGNNINDSTFKKINKSIKNEDDVKGSKADFLLTIYTEDIIGKKDEKWLEERVCGKAIFEAKTESDFSIHKKKNIDHLDKLEKDRKNENADTAILVTELEKEDDFLIKKSSEYPNIFMIRPSVLIPFISLYRNIILKQKDIVVKNIEFRDKTEILEEFNDFKNNLLDTTIKNIDKNIETIKKSSETIKEQADKILNSVSTITETHFSRLVKKIEDFKIEKKIINKMDKLQ